MVDGGPRGDIDLKLWRRGRDEIEVLDFKCLSQPAPQAPK